MFGQIKKVIVHGIGNKSLSEEVRLSGSEVRLTEKVNETLVTFLDNCKMSDATYQFFHESDELDLNPMYVYASRAFDDADVFKETSCNIAKQLYESSDHPKIHSGELIEVLFENCDCDGEKCEALGLFKSESKDKYLDLSYEGGSYTFVENEGLNVNTLEKGAVVFNTQREEGYCVKILMRSSKQVDAKYWMNDFLHVRQIDDSFCKTQQIISLTKGFVREVLDEDESVTRIERAEIMTRVSDYFSTNESFDRESFCNEVFKDPKQADGFEQYQEEMLGEDNSLSQPFEISKPLVKKQAKFFKSVIKLDRNFHIYVHGGEGLIKKGYDEETGMEYYQLYFKKEE